MSYWMYAIDELGRVIELKGDSGTMSIALKVSEDGRSFIDQKDHAEPEVGHCMQVGSHYARSYSAQDWWMTTPVTEIVSKSKLKDGRTEVVFKTKNSTYLWRG
jgi:hypothetical protein